jgi:hypothetical protein
VCDIIQTPSLHDKENLSSFFLVLAFEPDFVFPLENVTVAQGRDATFTCVVNNLGGYRVSGTPSEGTQTGSPARVRKSFVVGMSFFEHHFDHDLM